MTQPQEAPTATVNNNTEDIREQLVLQEQRLQQEHEQQRNVLQQQHSALLEEFEQLKLSAEKQVNALTQRNEFLTATNGKLDGMQCLLWLHLV